MRARVPVQYTAEQRKQIKKMIAEEYDKHREKEFADGIRRNYKMIAYALNRKYGFGKGRIGELLLEIQELAEESRTNPDFWRHLDKVVVDEIGLEFGKEQYL